MFNFTNVCIQFIRNIKQLHDNKVNHNKSRFIKQINKINMIRRTNETKKNSKLYSNGFPVRTLIVSNLNEMENYIVNSKSFKQSIDAQLNLSRFLET